MKWNLRCFIKFRVLLFSPPFGHTASIMTEWDELKTIKDNVVNSCPVDWLDTTLHISIDEK